MATGTDDGPTQPHGLINGRYALGAIIGRGGAAVVYLGQDLETGHNVAVKVLRREFADSTVRTRFLREIQLAAKLRHPSIVSVLDSGVVDGVPYYVMPVFSDGTLAMRFQSAGALPFDDVLRVTSELSAALDFAHAYDVLHRDVKPQNVLFDGNHPLLADFGIARALGQHDAERLTESGVVLGTPFYMSPEQAGGEAIIDRRSDVYSLGCVVYEMIAGEPPFVGPTAKAVIAKHFTEPIPSIAVVRPTVAEGVQSVLEGALAKVPADRYATAGEFARALAAVMPGSGPVVVSGQSARRTAPVSRRAFFTRHTWLWVALAILVIVGGVFLGRAATRRVTAGGKPVPDARRIAVLYFEDLSPTNVPSYLGDAFTETLIDQLSTVQALHVISAAGVRPFKNRPMRLDSIARTLNVGTIISGSVQKTGDSVRVAVRLVDAASGQQLNSVQILQPWSTIFQLQDSLTTQIAFALRQQLGDVIAVRANQASTNSRQAWEEVQLASQTVRSALIAYRGPDNRRAGELLLRADALYARAESLDGQWWLPTFKRATIAWLMGRWKTGLAPPGSNPETQSSSADTSTRMQWESRALRLADASLRKGSDSADVLRLQGAVFYDRAWRGMGRGASDSLFRASEASFQAAVRARPNFASAWAGLADIYIRDGRFADAADAALRAYRADAFFEVRATVSNGFSAALYSQRFDEAKTWCDAGLSRYPGDPQFAECRLRLLGWTAGRKHDDVARAWRELGDIERRDSTGVLKPSWASRRFMVAATIARAGLRDSALRVIDRIHLSGTPPGGLEEAWVRLLVGDREQALILVQQHLARSPIATAIVSRSPWFVSLHGDPRFEAAVRQAR